MTKHNWKQKIRRIKEDRKEYRFTELLDQGHGLSSEASLEPSTSAGTEHLDEFIGGHVEKCIEIHASKTELLERSLLRLPCCCCSRHIDLNVCLQMQLIPTIRNRKNNGEIKRQCRRRRRRITHHCSAC